MYQTIAVEHAARNINGARSNVRDGSVNVEGAAHKMINVSDRRPSEVCLLN
jgi:hypothetical protein